MSFPYPITDPADPLLAKPGPLIVRDGRLGWKKIQIVPIKKQFLAGSVINTRLYIDFKYE